MSAWVQPKLGEDQSPYVLDLETDAAIRNQHYPIGLWSLAHLAHAPVVQVIFIAQLEGRILVAVPASVWTRAKASRILPANALMKPQLLEVAACGILEREIAVEGLTMKIWAGYLKPELSAAVDFGQEEIEVEYTFEADCEGHALPSCDALVEAARDHFAFFSASEGLQLDAMDGGVAAPAALPAPEDAEPSSADVSSRVSNLERMMTSMAENLATLVQDRKPQSARPSALRSTSRKSSSATETRRVTLGASPKKIPRQGGNLDQEYSQLDASVVRAATQAGLGREVLQQLNRLVTSSSKSTRVADINPAITIDPLSDNEEEDWEARDDAGSGGSGLEAPQPVDPMQTAVMQLTDIARSLSEDRRKKSHPSRIDAALDQASHVTDSSQLGSGKRSAAARRALRAMLQEQPQEISAMIEKLMWEDISSQTLTPGVAVPSFSVRAWMEHRSRIGAYRTLAHAACGTAGALDCLIKNDVAGARARLGVMMVQFDQSAVDAGSWYLASELGLEIPPPFSVLEQHRQPNTAVGESPYSRILDSRWAELSVGHLREQEDFVTKRRALGKTTTKDKNEGDADSSRHRAKAKAKAKSSASEASA